HLRRRREHLARLWALHSDPAGPRRGPAYLPHPAERAIGSAEQLLGGRELSASQPRHQASALSFGPLPFAPSFFPVLFFVGFFLRALSMGVPLGQPRGPGAPRPQTGPPPRCRPRGPNRRDLFFRVDREAARWDLSERDFRDVRKLSSFDRHLIAACERTLG